MPSYNRDFELDPDDIDLIETGLRALLAASQDQDEIRRIHTLLGNLHNQKIWYRPKNNYISG